MQRPPGQSAQRRSFPREWRLAHRIPARRESSPGQTHHLKGMALKGLGFSRAYGNGFNRMGFSPRGKIYQGEDRPSGPKGRHSMRLWAAPFGFAQGRLLKPCTFKDNVPTLSIAWCVCPGVKPKGRMNLRDDILSLILNLDHFHDPKSRSRSRPAPADALRRTQAQGSAAAPG